MGRFIWMFLLTQMSRRIRRGGNFFQVAACVVAWVFCPSGQCQIEPPTLVSPANGAVLQLVEGTNQLLLQWSRVGDATGYLLTVEGPEAFPNLTDVRLDQSGQPTVNFTLNNVRAGDYAWEVRSTVGNQISAPAAGFFTIFSQPTGGGSLPAPSLLQPFDFAIFRGENGVITFQWTRVQGATDYQISRENLGVSIGIPVDSRETIDTVERQSFLFSPGNRARLITWSVTPIGPDGPGQESERRTFLFTPDNVQSDNLLFHLPDNWLLPNARLNLDEEPLFDFPDAFLLLPFRRRGAINTNEESGGPALLQPGSSHTPSNITFVWRPIPGARSYEFNLMDSQNRFKTTHWVRQPISPNNASTVVQSLSVGNYAWRVRAFFGSGRVATTYSPPSALTIISGSS